MFFLLLIILFQNILTSRLTRTIPHVIGGQQRRINIAQFGWVVFSHHCFSRWHLLNRISYCSAQIILNNHALESDTEIHACVLGSILLGHALCSLFHLIHPNIFRLFAFIPDHQTAQLHSAEVYRSL